ncbi:hypothetical protein FOA52_001131 [Chlamydomonas sp. UWO 241]|nr:hypothetical protein FOA52_001131 [Chlamydomonas sp. UWO 241]
MMKSSVAMVLALVLASGVCVDARFGSRGLPKPLQSAPVDPPATVTTTAVSIAEAVASGGTGAAATSPTSSPDIIDCCTDWTPRLTSCNSLGPLGYRFSLVSVNPPTWRDKYFKNDCTCE